MAAPIPPGVDPYEWHRAELITVLQQVQASGLPATAAHLAAIQAAQTAMAAAITPPAIVVA